MKVYKDVLQALSIENVNINFNGRTFFCIPLEISDSLWTVAIDGDFTINGLGELCIKWKNEYLKFNCAIESLIGNSFSLYSCMHQVSIALVDESPVEMEFHKLLRELEKDLYRNNKRKEERFEIRENIRGMRLDKPEQKILTSAEELPCLIDNISFGGARIITYDSYFQKEKPVCLYLSFIEPVEQIPIKAFVRNYTRKKSQNGNQDLAVLSLEYERAPISYQNRVKRLIEYINHNSKKDGH